jgi:hypothetical protein
MPKFGGKALKRKGSRGQQTNFLLIQLIFRSGSIKKFYFQPWQRYGMVCYFIGREH